MSRWRGGAALAVGPEHEQAIVADPSDQVRRFGEVADDRVVGAELVTDLRRDRIRELRRYGGLEPEMPNQALEERRGHARRHHDTVGSNRRTIRENVRGLSREGDALHRRPLEDLRATARGRGGESDAGAMRIDGGAVLFAKTGHAIEGQAGAESRAR